LEHLIFLENPIFCFSCLFNHFHPKISEKTYICEYNNV